MFGVKYTKFGIFAGQETFFSIRLSVRTSAMCILLVQTTKLLAQKIRHDSTGSEKFFFSYNYVVIQSDKLDHIFPCLNGKATRLGYSGGLSFLP